MAWAKMDDRYPENPKVLAAGDAAAWMHLCAILYSNRNLTDGFIPNAVIPRLTADPLPSALASTLVEVGLFTEVENGFQINDYLEHQTSAEKVKEKRAGDRVRKKSARNPNGVQSDSKRQKEETETEEDLTDLAPQLQKSFNGFWDLYPKKKSKKAAARAWAKLTPTERTAAIAALPRATSSPDWRKEDGKFVPYPATWLNAGGWEDEHPPAHQDDGWAP